MAHIIWFYGLEQRYPIWGNFVPVQKVIFVSNLRSSAILPISYQYSIAWVKSLMSYSKMEHQLDYWLNLIIDFFSRSTWFKVFKSTILMRQTRLIQWCRKSNGITVSDYRFWCLFIWNLEFLHVAISTQSFHRQLEFRNWFQVNRFWTWNSRARHVTSKISKFAT